MEISLMSQWHSMPPLYRQMTIEGKTCVSLYMQLTREFQLSFASRASHDRNIFLNKVYMFVCMYVCFRAKLLRFIIYNEVKLIFVISNQHIRTRDEKWYSCENFDLTKWFVLMLVVYNMNHCKSLPSAYVVCHKFVGMLTIDFNICPRWLACHSINTVSVCLSYESDRSCLVIPLLYHLI